MDPNARNYDRPPAGYGRRKRRQRPPVGLQTRTEGRPVSFTPPGLTAAGPRLPGGPGPPPTRKPDPRRQAIQRMQGGFKDPRKGFPTAYPQGFPKAKMRNDEGKKIGFYNATHRHGKPDPNLAGVLAKLKRKRKAPMKASFSPDPSASPR